MSFKQLSWATIIYHNKYPYFSLVSDWGDKRQHLTVYIHDLPYLVQDYKNTPSHQYKGDTRITIVNEVPMIRLASACEAATNCLYSMAEVSAQFANKTSKGYFPSSFNAFRKNLEMGMYGSDLVQRMGDLQWYRKVREIRTEFVHHSTIYIGQAEDEPIMVVHAHRRPSDKQEFSSDIQVTIPELINWIQGAFRTVDAFGGYLLEKYILPNFPLDERVHVPKTDENGMIVFLSDGRVDMEIFTVRDYLKRGGISLQ